MRLINKLTNDANQNLQVLLEDGSSFYLTLNYRENQSGWFYSIVWGTISIYNRRLVVSENMLRQLRNVLPFGLTCVSIDGYEPVFKDDFSTERVKIFLLNATDVLSVEDHIPTYAE